MLRFARFSEPGKLGSLDSNISIKNVRDAGNLLATDYTLIKSIKYEKSWTAIISGLESIDSIARYQALLSIRLLGDDIDRCVGSELKCHLVTLLINLISSEENIQIRTLGCVCLGICIKIFSSKDSLPASHRRTGFKAVLVEFFKIFPSHTRKFKDPGIFDLRSNISKTIFETRIQMIFAIANCFCIPEANTDYFQRYIDELFLAILKANSHSLMISAVIDALTKNLPKTNRNRIRIEMFYRNQIDLLISLHHSDTLSNRPSTIRLVESFNLFMSTWWPLPTDKTLLFSRSSNGDNLILHGFAAKRYAYLKDEGDALFEDLNQSGKLALMQKVSVEPYTAPKYFQFQVSLFEKIMEVDDARQDTAKFVAHEEEMVETVLVPPKESLTFKLNNNMIEFSASARAQKLFLENVTSDDQPFVIQISSPYFSASPSYGQVAKLTAIPIKLSFNRTLLKQPGLVKGYLYIRTRLGFPMERIFLSGYNLPAVKMSCSVLDFGICPANESRTATFSVTNLLPVECTLIMIMASGENSTRFHLPQAQIVLPPHEVKHVTMKASFLAEGDIRENLILIAYGGQMIKLRLTAHCGKSMKLLEDNLNFGPTDIFFDPIVKKLTMINMSQKNSLAISYMTSTDEIQINQGKRIILEPGAKIPVPVQFTSNYTGKRIEKITLFAPNSGGSKVIAVNAMSGPYLKVPIYEDIYITPCCAGETTFIRIPITNLMSDIGYFHISVPTDFPVKLVSCLFLFANSVENKFHDVYQAKEYAAAGLVGLKVGLPPLSTSVIEVAMIGIKEGFFKIPLKISMLSPRKYDLGSFNLFAFIYNEEMLLKFFNSDKPLKNFFSKPYLHANTEAYVFENIVEFDGKKPRTDVFRIEPSLLTVYGPTAGRLACTLDFVNLINMTSEPQGYRIFLSAHFKTTINLEGVLPPSSSLEVPIRFNPKFLTNQETTEFFAIGCLTVLDTNANYPSIISSQLTGVIDELLALEVRDPSAPIKFPNLTIIETSKRQVLIRNKSSIPLQVQFQLENFRDERLLSSTNAADTFSLLNSKPITLKPFELYAIEVIFRGNYSGDYEANLSISYDIAPGATARLVGQKELSTLSFFGSIGAPDIVRQPDFLSFGDVPIGDQILQNISLQNNASTDCSLQILPPSFLTIKNNELIQVGKLKNRIEVPVIFMPENQRQFHQHLTFASSVNTHSIPILGVSGILSMVSNLGTPVFVDEDFINPPNDAAVFNIGNISFGDTKRKIVHFLNNGTLDAFISKVSLLNDNLITLEPVYRDFVGTIASALTSTFGDKFLENNEIDLDNFEYLAENSTKHVVQQKTKAGQFYKKRADSIVASSKMALKLFGDIKSPDFHNDHGLIGTYPLFEAFPVRLRPLQDLELGLKINANVLGSFIVPIILKINRYRRDPISYAIWVKGRILRPLFLETKKIDFGAIHVLEKMRSSIVFTNEELFPIPWTLSHISTKLVPLEGIDSGYLPFLNQPRCPVEIFPSSGTLIPGGTQTIDVTFSTSIPHAETYSLFQLKSGDFNTQDVLIQATGGSGCLTADPLYFDFGTLRVGSSQTKKLVIKNSGMLSCTFFLENLDPDFSAEPELDEISGGSEKEINIRFCPTKPTFSAGLMRLHTIPKMLSPPIDIKLSGMGGYPKITMNTKVIDFGTALYMAINKRRIEIQNIGAAEALIVFECSHLDLTIDTSSSDALQIGPGQSKNLTILYHPQVVEKLNVKAYFKSSDNRGETFAINIKGDVGIPKLTINPSDAFSRLNFGVMRLNKTYKKSFMIVNDGTIFLSFKTSIEAVSITEISESGKTGRVLNNVMCPISVVPSEGKLGLGESIEIQMHFLPTMLAEYEYEFKLSYEFQNFTATVKGVGGRSAPKILSPFENFDFELCRLGRMYEKSIQIYNTGNLGFYYSIRPAVSNNDYSIYSNEMMLYEEEEKRIVERDCTQKKWYHDLKQLGITIAKADGYCGPKSRMEISVQFRPEKEMAVKQEFLFIHDGRFDTFSISGVSSTAKLYLFDPHTKTKIENSKLHDIKIGVHPVNVTHRYNLDLVNPGPFGVDFLMQPMSSMEYEIFPLRGYIEPKSTLPISIAFRPSSESKFFSNLRVLWEGESIKANVYGDGGVGRLEVIFLEERDTMLKSLDFGMVPFNTPCRKRFFVSNYGMVGVIASLETENEDYAISIMGEAIPAKEGGLFKPNRDTISSWSTSLKAHLLPNKSVQIGVRYLPRNSTTSVGNITIRSDSGSFTIPLKGKGGTIVLGHKGDLDFGDISCNYIYTRKITVTNSGSIAANVNGSWAVVGFASESPLASIDLAETYSALDPRSQWARHQFCSKKGINANSQLRGSDYWKLIEMMINKDSAQVAKAVASSKKSLETDIEPNERLPLGKRKIASGSSNHFKRRQMFYYLITSTQLTSQSTLKVKPFIRISPPSLALSSYGEASFTVELNLGSEDTFLATLVLKPDIPNSQKYEIPLTATPKVVNIFCDDTRTLDFYRQPIGETESIIRKFSNLGHKDVPFKFINTNLSLTIFPAKGVLKIGQTILVTFSFTPVDEAAQTDPVIFEPLFSHPIRFKMYGGGGYAKASLSRYRRFDFGHCMIGKDTVSFLPILNEGNALLHLVKFDLQETDTFFKGQDWPTKRVSLFPGKNYNLPLVFNPHEENPAPGTLTIGTISESFEIELIGLGREAVLIVSKLAMEFSECLIGNTYEQKVGLKNIGDVNYPVSFHLEKEFPDMTFFPPNLVISPFSENFVTITYKPSIQIKTTIVLTLQSPYSTHKVPVMVHAGVAFLDFVSEHLDFGMFERTTRPSVVLSMKNSGTVKTNFYIKDAVKPSVFIIEPHKGIIYPKKSIDIKISHVKHEVSHFDETINIRTDLVDKIYNIRVSGECEETVLHENEFTMLNLGVCPVLEGTTKPILFKNYGKFPLRFKVQSAYPLKVFPNEGNVAGGGTGSVNVTWSPSGGYELRTQLTMFTNIGKYQIFVRGKSMFPEIAVSANTLDFGVCAVGYGYNQHFILENKGKVKLNYIIPPCKEQSYVASSLEGALEAKESKRIDVLFSPKVLGKLSGSLIVDVKGVHYKEVLMSGIGGTMDTEVDPLAIELERCPFGMKLYNSIKVINNGDVTLHVDFSSTQANQDTCMIDLPQPQIIYPKQSLAIPIGFSIFIVGRFYAKIVMTTKEQEFIIPVTGVGIKITLSNKSKKILSQERLSSLKILNPLTTEPEYLPVEFSIKRQYDNYQLAMKIYELISSLFTEELSLNDQKEENEMVPVTYKRKSFVLFSNIEELSPQFREAAGYNLQEELELPRLSQTAPDRLEDINPVENNVRNQPHQLTFRSTSLSKIQLPSIGSLGTTPPSNDIPEENEIELLEDGSDEKVDNGEKIYIAEQLSENSSSLESSPKETALEPEQDVSISDLIEKEDEIRQRQSNSNEDVENVFSNNNEMVRSTLTANNNVNASMDREELPFIEEPVITDEFSSSISSLYDTSYEGHETLFKAITAARNPFTIINYDEIQKLADTFVGMKSTAVPELGIAQDSETDPIVQAIIDNDIIKIRDIDLEPILYYENHAFDPIDLDFITRRPAPFRKIDEEKMKPKSKFLSVELRKGYLANFPKLERRNRNAHSNPLGE